MIIVSSERILSKLKLHPVYRVDCQSVSFVIKLLFFSQQISIQEIIDQKHSNHPGHQAPLPTIPPSFAVRPLLARNRAARGPQRIGRSVIRNSWEYTMLNIANSSRQTSSARHGGMDPYVNWSSSYATGYVIIFDWSIMTRKEFFRELLPFL